MSRKPQRKRIVAQEALELIDDSKDGLNLLLKKTNIKLTENVTNLDYLHAVKGSNVLPKSTNTFSLAKSKFFKSDGKLCAGETRKDDHNVRNTFHDTKELDDIIDEPSRKRSLMCKPETDAKRPKKKVSRRDRIIFASSVGEIDWGSIEESKTLSDTISLTCSKMRTMEDEKKQEPAIQTSESEEKFPGFHPKQQLTAQRLARRQAQIDIGKQTLGYKNYHKFFNDSKKIAMNNEEYETYVSDILLRANGRRNTIKKDLYSVDVFPTTPRKNADISKRQWDVVVRRWRRSLHMYDDVTTQEQFDKVTSSNKDKLKTRVAKFKRKSNKPVRNGFSYKK